MAKTNEVILAFIGEPYTKDSTCTRTGHGYDAFVCTEREEIHTLFKSLCLWGGAYKTYKKGDDYYSYFELDCRHRDFYKSEIFQRICKPYNINLIIYEDGRELYDNFYRSAIMVR
jgi:hypothetical protein